MTQEDKVRLRIKALELSTNNSSNLDTQLKNAEAFFLFLTKDVGSPIVKTDPLAPAADNLENPNAGE